MRRTIASFFGSGLILGRLRGSDLGSGTVGSAVALPLSLLLGDRLGWGAQLGAAVVAAVVGLWACRRVAEEEGDAGWVVIDEVAGTFLATTGLLGWPALIAFAVFRLADIVKRWFPGVHQADRLPGAFGIMADDLVAALYALAVGQLLRIALF